MDTSWLREVKIMPEIKKLQRYQNPELFERLAMEYAIGMMHGGARRRFEQLMDQHLYLRATTEAYEQQFAHFAELLPHKQPNSRVWKKLEKNIKQEAKQKEVNTQQLSNVSWWSSVKLKLAGMITALIVALSVMLFPYSSVQAYVAVLETDQHQPVAMAMVKPDDGIRIQLMKEPNIANNMELTLWCLPKEKNKPPMLMGTLNKSATSTIKIDKKMWKGLAEVKSFAISMEPKGNHNLSKPQGKILYKGDLKAMMDTK